MPVTLLAGHTKCGTTWLSQAIELCPNVELLRSHNFAGDFPIDLGEKPIVISRSWTITSDEDCRRFTSINPLAQAIVIYREPIDAILSYHNYQRAITGIKDSDVFESIKAGRLREILFQEFSYHESAKRLRRYFSTFREYLYDDIKKDNEAFLDDVLQFCGARPTYGRIRKSVNNSLAYRSYLVQRILMKSMRLLTGVDTALFRHAYADGEMAPSVLKILMDANNKPRHFLSRRQLESLKSVAAPIVTQLKGTTSLDLSAWGY